MARSFGKEKDEDDKKDEISGAPAPDPQQGASWNGNCYADEGDSTQSHHRAQFSSDEISEDAAEGQHLYLDFVRTEIVRNGMETELPCLESSNEQQISEICNPQRILDWTRAGQELRQLADAFSQSKQRQTVRKRAQNLSIESLDIDNFLQLLQELFQGGGITRERILVLFFFCADVTIEALRRGYHQTFHQLLQWSFRYIATSVAQYVHSVGGWGVVLRQSLDIAYQVTATCAFVAVVAACMIFIRRNLS